jgi:TRAP-type C4-dicarboxylate transport system permease small subunit
MEKFARVIDRLIEVAGVIALISATFMVLINVFNRYVILGWLRTGGENSDILAAVFSYADTMFSPLSATADEVPGLLLVWIAFLGAYLAYRKGGHISFDMIVESLPTKIRTFVAMLSDVTLMIFLVILLAQSIRMIFVDGETEIETAEIAQGWFMSIIPITSVLMMFALILSTIKRISSSKE